MEVVAIIIAAVLCGMIVKLSEWRENRKEEKERQRMVMMNQDAAARQIMEESLNNNKSKSIILFIPQIPNLEDYLRLELNEFFRAHQFVGNEMTRLREEEESLRSQY